MPKSAKFNIVNFFEKFSYKEITEKRIEIFCKNTHAFMWFSFTYFFLINYLWFFACIFTLSKNPHFKFKLI